MVKKISLGLVALIWVMSSIVSSAEPVSSTGPRPEPALRDQYGGADVVYDRIASERDCSVLQAEFDRAAANNDLATPGTAGHKRTVGYMRAANDQMEAAGCY